MKIFKLSLIATSFLLIGCGGGSSSSTSSTVELTPVETVEEATTSYKALDSFESLDISTINEGYSKMSLTMQKTESASCTDGGTLGYDAADDGSSLVIFYNDCQMGSQYYNGTISFTMDSSYNQVIDISNYTYRDIGGEQYMNITMSQSMSSDEVLTTVLNGVINQTDTNNGLNNVSFNDMRITEKNTYTEAWSTIDGLISLESKCVTGSYQFKTIEKLVDTRDGTYNTQSGILDINGATYTFENPYVTIKTVTEEKTILQSELMEDAESTSCN
jgi:hypothetical protein